MTDAKTCGDGAACEMTCPFMMIGRACPDMDELAHTFNVIYGLTPQQESRLQSVCVPA